MLRILRALRNVGGDSRATTPASRGLGSAPSMSSMYTSASHLGAGAAFQSVK